jgi:4-hydroxy-tetrahydrodipicolinate synthase
MKSASKDHAGLYCYVVTPYDERGNVDVGTLEKYVNAMLESGVDGITCIASTCEGPYLTDEERRVVAATVGKVVQGKVWLNIGVGAVSTRQAIEFAKQAQEAGATSLMVDMPQYFEIGFDDACRHYETIARAVPIPIRLYNIVAPTRFDFTPQRIAQIAGIAAIRSVKEASGDVNRIRQIRSLCGDRFALFCGFHYQCLEAFRLGAVGWEAMLHPLIAKPCVDLYRALEKDPWGKEAELLYGRLQPLFDFFRFNGVPQSIKAISSFSDLGLGMPRPPLAELGAHSAERLKAILRELETLG